MVVDTKIGENTIIRQPSLVNIYKCDIGKGCKIAAFVEIGESVAIGDRCRIQAFCFIPWGVTIGDDVFVGPGVVFMNVKYPPSPRSEWRETVIKSGVTIGAGALILPGVTIGRGAFIGAGAVVTKNVEPGSTVVGVPAVGKIISSGLNFGLIGDGRAAKRHREAIRRIGGDLVVVYDPILYPRSTLGAEFFRGLKYAVICSPTQMHYEHIKTALKRGVKVIVEKPMVLPWQPIIDNNDISVVMQLRWLKRFRNVDKIWLRAVRDNAYFESWRGDSEKNGGLFFNLFIHYIDLAMSYKAKFEALVSQEGVQERWIGDFDLLGVDMDTLYERMYRDIVFHDKGIKPADVAPLHWVLGKYSGKYGSGRDILDKKLVIDFKNFDAGS